MPSSSKPPRNAGVIVRKATRADANAVVDLIIGLAQFERLEPPDPKAKERLAKDIFDKKLARVIVASIGGKLAGYALYFYTYSSFLARPTLYLEDIDDLRLYRLNRDSIRALGGQPSKKQR